MSEARPTPPLWLSLARTALRLVLVFALAYGVNLLAKWAMTHADALGPNARGMVTTSIIVSLFAAYIIMIATPFVPGVEIGLALMFFEGPSVVPFIYASTIFGLMLAYLAGRLLPYSVLRKILLDLRLGHAVAQIEALQSLSAESRLELLRARLPRWLGRHLLNWRYMVLAVLINLPGNSLLGGGGGLCLMAGLSRVFQPVATAVTIALAVSPVPIAVWIFGMNFLR